MDGSATSSLAERTRSQFSRAFVNRTANEANAQSELFEQLLNLSFTVQPPPEPEPEPLDTASTIASGSSTSGKEKNAAKVEEDKEYEPVEAVSSLAQTVQLIAETPVDLNSEQPVVAIQAIEETLKPTNVDSTEVNEQLTAADNAGTSDPLSAVVNERVVATNAQITDSTSDTKIPADSVLEDSASAIANQGDVLSNKRAVKTTTEIDDANANLPQEVTPKNEKEDGENTVTKAQHEVARATESGNLQQEGSQDHRGERRERWFERSDESNKTSTLERPIEPRSSYPARENVDVPKIETIDPSSPSSTVAASSLSDPPIAPAMTLPVALPAGLSIAPQNSAATPTPAATTTNTASPESTTAVTASPSRPVGKQGSKLNAKETVAEPGLSQQERVRVIQRIARSFNRISPEGGSINLRLHPEHLGSVSMQVRLEGRSLSARLSTETAAARDAIMKDLPALRQRLADQGFDVTKFQVDVAGNGADASFAQSNGQPQFGQSENRPSGAQTDYRRMAANREARAAMTRQSTPATSPIWHNGTSIDLHA
jgi:flagellar hook-length control protein FliK